MANQIKSRYDIIINGGGIVGFTFLNAILKSRVLNRCKVLLIEQAKRPQNINPETDQPEANDSERKFSNRVSSITLASKKVLDQVGAWKRVEPFAKDVNSIKVWNYDYSNKIVFKQNLTTDYYESSDNDVMFSVVENNHLSRALLETIHQHKTGPESIAWGYSLEHMSKSLNSDLIEISARNPESEEEISTSAPLILGCDGFKSKVRDLAHIRYKECDLMKTAVVGTVRMASGQGNNNVAYQRFSARKDTVAALLPLNNEFSSFVISAPNDYSKFIMDLDDYSFIEEFNSLLMTPETANNIILKGIHQASNLAYDGIHGILKLLSQIRQSTDPKQNTDTDFDEPPALESLVENSRASFPLFFGTTTPKMAAPIHCQEHLQIGLLGDASHRVHPLAGQGLNLGIQDAIELVRQLEKMVASGEKVFGDTDMHCIHRALRRFEIRRQAYIIPMSAGILSMPYLFKLAPSRAIYSSNKCEPMKKLSVRMANGL